MVTLALICAVEVPRRVCPLFERLTVRIYCYTVRTDLVPADVIYETHSTLQSNASSSLFVLGYNMFVRLLPWSWPLRVVPQGKHNLTPMVHPQLVEEGRRHHHRSRRSHS
jgi:hypothetical protein